MLKMEVQINNDKDSGATKHFASPSFIFNGDAKQSKTRWVNISLVPVHFLDADDQW